MRSCPRPTLASPTSRTPTRRAATSRSSSSTSPPAPKRPASTCRGCRTGAAGRRRRSPSTARTSSSARSPATHVVNWRTGEVDDQRRRPGRVPRRARRPGGRAGPYERRGSSTPAPGRRSSRCRPRAATRWCGSPPTAGWRPWPPTRCRTHRSVDLYTVDTGAARPGRGRRPVRVRLDRAEPVLQRHPGRRRHLPVGRGRCHTQPLPDGLRLEGLVRLGGVVYES